MCRDSAKRAKRRAEPAYLGDDFGCDPDFEITVEDPEIDRVFSTTPDYPRLPPMVDPVATAYAERDAERAKRDLKKEHRALLDENERLKKERDEVRAANRAPDILVYKQPSWERSDAVACALISDLHVEEPVDAASIHGMNEYNLEIAKARMEKLFKGWLRLTNIMARESAIKTMYMGVLGDCITGWIHEEGVAGNLLAPGDAARFCKGLFISGIEYILKESDYVIEGDCIPGNHGRMTKKVHFADPTGTSLETVMYEGIADRFHGNPRVRLNVSGQAMVYRDFFERFKMRLIHGYEIQYQGGIGGVTVPIRKKLAGWDKAIKASLTVMGHFHQRLDGGDFMVNGSLIGYNNYAQVIGASPEAAQQSFFLVDARNGGVKSVVAPIWVTAKADQLAGH